LGLAVSVLLPLHGFLYVYDSWAVLLSDNFAEHNVSLIFCFFGTFITDFLAEVHTAVVPLVHVVEMLQRVAVQVLGVVEAVEQVDAVEGHVVEGHVVERHVVEAVVPVVLAVDWLIDSMMWDEDGASMIPKFV
jgi:hypothetical protein